MAYAQASPNLAQRLVSLGFLAHPCRHAFREGRNRLTALQAG